MRAYATAKTATVQGSTSYSNSSKISSSGSIRDAYDALRSNKNVTMPVHSNSSSSSSSSIRGDYDALRINMNVTMIVQVRTVGGLGNILVSALEPLLALARAAGRNVFVTGPSVVWRQFWNSSFSYDHQAVGLQCGLTQIEDRVSQCHKVVFESPDTVLVVTADGGHGLPMIVTLSHPLFAHRYLEAHGMNTRTTSSIQF
jgi:hypothetical protein